MLNGLLTVEWKPLVSTHGYILAKTTLCHGQTTGQMCWQQNAPQETIESYIGGESNKMSKQTPSRDFHLEFEHTWGGTPSEVQQFENWERNRGVVRWLAFNFLLPQAQNGGWIITEREMGQADKQAATCSTMMKITAKRRPITTKLIRSRRTRRHILTLLWPGPDCGIRDHLKFLRKLKRDLIMSPNATPYPTRHWKTLKRKRKKIVKPGCAGWPNRNVTLSWPYAHSLQSCNRDASKSRTALIPCLSYYSTPKWHVLMLSMSSTVSISMSIWKQQSGQNLLSSSEATLSVHGTQTTKGTA